MTTELEKQFFETFEIPKIYKTTINIGDLDVNLKEIQAPTLKELYEIAKYDFTTPIYFSWFKRSKRWSEEYPEITDSILLSLVKIACKENIISLTRMKNGSKEWAVYFGLDKSCIFYEKSFKDVILKAFIEYSNDRDIYTRVQKLFKGNNE